jgi:hypothetical protein
MCYLRLVNFVHVNDTKSPNLQDFAASHKQSLAPSGSNRLVHSTSIQSGAKDTLLDAAPAMEKCRCNLTVTRTYKQVFLHVKRTASCSLPPRTMETYTYVCLFFLSFNLSNLAPFNIDHLSTVLQVRATAVYFSFKK